MAENIIQDDFKHFEHEMTVNGHYLWESRSTSSRANSEGVILTVKHIRMIDQDYIEVVQTLRGDKVEDRKTHTNLGGSSAIEQFEKNWQRMWDPDHAIEKLPPLGKRLAEENRHEIQDFFENSRSG